MDSEPIERRDRGFRFSLDPRWAEDVERDVIPHLFELRDRPDVRLVKENNVRTVLRVPFRDTAIYLKRYHVRGFTDWVKYLFVPSRAVAEWRAARTLEEQGLPGVKAVLMGEKRRGGILLDGTFATLEIPDALDFVPYVHEHLFTPQTEEARRALLTQLARLVRRFHDGGSVHDDLHSGNLLVTGPPEDPKVHLIDLHTVGLGRVPGATVRRANLTKLLHSLSTGTRGDRRRFLDDYEADRPVLGDRAAVLDRVRAGVDALEVRRVRSRTKRCLRHSSSFRPDRLGGLRLYRSKDVPAEALPYAIGDHLLSRRERERGVLKDSNRSALTRQLVPAPDPCVVVKETKCRDLGDVLKNAFRPPRALASWVNGNGLLVREIGAARPLAVALKGGWPAIRESYLLMEDVSALERLDLFVLARYAGPLAPELRAEKVRLVESFGRFVGDLHRRGIYHGDLKAVNVYVGEGDLGEGGEPEFKLVDYDRVVFGKRVSLRRRVKNLAQIAASVAVLITRTDRLRFFRAYAGDGDAWAKRKVYNRGVERECAKKIVVRMQPIE